MAKTRKTTPKAEPNPEGLQAMLDVAAKLYTASKEKNDGLIKRLLNEIEQTIIEVKYGQKK